MNKEQILNMLKETSVKGVQIDPNGVCNNKCWYCPLAYKDYPQKLKTSMPIELFEYIVSQLSPSNKGLLSEDRCYMWTAHYNEILLYKHFEEMLKIFQKYNIATSILTNGTLLTKEKIEIIKRYPRVVVGIDVNIPAGNPVDYAKYTGRDESIFYKVIENIKLCAEELPLLDEKNAITFSTNGIDENQWHGREMIGRMAPEIPYNDMINQNASLKKLMPGINTYLHGGLTDRAGHLKEFDIIDNSEMYPGEDEEIYDCMMASGDNGRMFGWIHIDATGELFLCCNDFDCSYRFGNVKEKTIREIWYSEEHVEAIHMAMNNICKTCCWAMRR